MKSLVAKIVAVLALVGSGLWFAVSTYTFHPDFFWYGIASGVVAFAIVVRIPHAWQNPDGLTFPWNPRGISGYEFLLRLYDSVGGKVLTFLVFVWQTWWIVGLNYWAWLGGFVCTIFLSIAAAIVLALLNRYFPPQTPQQW